MFEKAKPVPQAFGARFSGQKLERFAAVQPFDDDLPIGSLDSAPDETGGEDDALRMIEWGELTARLNAARDLRDVLRRDAKANAGDNSSSFADAAARYFRTREHNEPDVNPVALEHRKGSPGMIHDDDQTHFENAGRFQSNEVSHRGHAVQGDARED